MTDGFPDTEPQQFKQDKVKAEHDLDGTPLPAGHQKYTAEQERFFVLWEKCMERTATPEETAEMLRLQEEYWDHKHDRIYEDYPLRKTQ